MEQRKLFDSLDGGQGLKRRKPAPKNGKYIDIEGVGPVLFERSSRARRFNIRVRPFHGVRVAVPRGASFRAALAFAQSQVEWIRQHLARVRELEERTERQEMVERLRALAGTASGIDRREAGQQIIKRLEELAAEHGFTYSKVTIRCQRSRWGSCSSKNNISLNVKLVKLPAQLLDYVILHELVHTRIKNHSKEFWHRLDRYVGDARALRKRLGNYNLARL
jgi:predicted metal-dependent hydrolase